MVWLKPVSTDSYDLETRHTGQTLNTNQRKLKSSTKPVTQTDLFSQKEKQKF